MKKGLWIAVVLMAALLAVSPAVAAKWGTPILWQHTSNSTQRMPWLQGDTLYYVENYDIMFSVWDGSQWSAPAPVPGPINTGANEINPALARDGKVLYFGRYDPISDYDFYRSEWDEAKKAWGKPELVAQLSSDTQEWDIWVDNDETVAYITSKGSFGGKSSLGGQDIWKAVKEGDRWGTPVNLSALNTDGSEWSVHVGPDGEIYFDSSRAGSVGDYDIWTAANDTAKPENMGTPVNSATAERAMTFNDKFFAFTGVKREGRPGYDLWMAPKEGVVTVIVQPSAAAPSFPLQVSGTLEFGIDLNFEDPEADPIIGGSQDDIAFKLEMNIAADPGIDAMYKLGKYSSNFYIDVAHVKWTGPEASIRLFYDEDYAETGDPFALVANDDTRRGNEKGIEFAGNKGNLSYMVSAVTDQPNVDSGRRDVAYGQVKYTLPNGLARATYVHYGPIGEATQAVIAIDGEYILFEDMKVVAEAAQMTYAGSPYEDNAYYVKGTYTLQDTTFSAGYRAISDRFDSVMNSEKAMEPNRVGYEAGVRHAFNDRVAVSFDRLALKNVLETDDYNTNTLGMELNFGDLTLASDYEMAEQAGKETNTIDLSAKYAPLNAAVGVSRTVGDSEALTWNLSVSPTSSLTLKFGYDADKSKIRGEASYEFIPSVTAKVMYKVQDDPENSSVYYAEVVKKFRSGSTFEVSYGVWDDGNIDEDWAMKKNAYAGFSLLF